jgi:pullulanase
VSFEVKKLPFNLIAPALLIWLSACERPEAPAPPPAPAAPHYLPVEEATGSEFVTLQIAPPARSVGRPIIAGLEQNGRLVALGSSAVSPTGMTAVAMRWLNASTRAQTGECDLWLVLDQDNMPASYPGFGDRFLRDKWQWPRVNRVMVYSDPTTWQIKSLSSETNLVTIHYHRFDGDYANTGIWSWDANRVKSPAENELRAVGRDEYGLIFQFDRADYGTDKIGLLPRLNADWGRKDGEDKFWQPELGDEIYLIGGKKEIWSTRPDTGPQVIAAFIDAPDKMVVELSRVIPVGEEVMVRGKGKEAKGKGQGTTRVEVALQADVVTVDGFAGSARAVPRGILNDEKLFGDRQAVLGATVSATGTTFRVFAPSVEKAEVVLYDSPTGIVGRAAVAMVPVGKGIWQKDVGGDLRGKFYAFCVDGREVLDPYAVNAVDSSRRALIAESTGWQGPAGPVVKSPVDMVIYEMHVRDFSMAANSGMKAKGKYLAFTESGTHLPGDDSVKTGLDHLTELGVTHVQLLPVQDFDNDESVSTNYNWGYVTMAYNSPEGEYASNPNDGSRVREFKGLVAALHARGIGVILDVVYNHTSGNAPLNSLVTGYFYRMLPDGSFANGSGCGNELRTESLMGRKYVIDTLKYWVKEYGVDGFRFDLMALVDVDTMLEAEKELRKLRPDIVLYGEPWGAGPSPLRRPANKDSIFGTHIGAFNDAFRNAVIGSPFDQRPGFVETASNMAEVRRGLEGAWREWATRPAQAINYLSCHDNRTAWDRLKLSRPGATTEQLVDMMKVGYLLLFTAQGVPFIHGGEEFGRNKYGHDNTYNAPDAINEVDWSLKKYHAGLFQYVRDLIALRKAHPVFRLRAKEQIAAWLKFHDTGNPKVLMYTYDASRVPGESWKKVCVIVNVNDEGNTAVTLPPGQWRFAFNYDGLQKNVPVAQKTIAVRHKSGLILYW